jgi:cytochrome c oxidase subunit II
MMPTIKHMVAALTLGLASLTLAPSAMATVAPAAAPVAAPTAAPADPATAAPVAVPPAAATAAAPADAAAAAPATERPTFDYARPVDGIGQPVDRGMDFQPQVTENGEYAHWMNNALLLPMMAVVSLVVLGLMLWITVRFRKKANPVPSKTTHNTLLEVIWTLVPVVILVIIAVPSIDLLARQYAPPPRDAVTIKVTGYQWNWGYEYPDHGIPEYISRMLTRAQAAEAGEPFQLGVDNRMVVPVGQTVKLIVTGSDVIHSFAVPALWTKMDAVPGRLNEVTFRAEREGVYYGQCSELCGVDHAFMPIAVEVVSRERFAQWVASRGGTMPGTAAPAAAPAPATAAPAPAAPAPAAPAAAPAPAPAQ